MDSTSQDREGAGQLARVDRMGKGALPGVLAALMALTSDAVLTLDGDARILTANAQAEALTELTLDELVARASATYSSTPTTPRTPGPTSRCCPRMARSPSCRVGLPRAGRQPWPRAATA